MKRIAPYILTALAAFAALWLFGVIGFKYPVMVEGDALLNPVRVRSVVDGRIELMDGRLIQCDSVVSDALRVRLADSGGMVELSPRNKSEVDIFAGQTRHGYCGTPFAQPLCIPLVRVEIPRHLKCFVGCGAIVEEEMKEANKPLEAIGKPPPQG